MTKKRAKTSSRPPSVAKRRSTEQQRTPILQSADLRTILFDLATRLAPADVSALIGDADELRAQAAQLGAADPPRLRSQLNLALDLLRDHVEGACPQIPYYTIALLAAAVCYFSEQLDVIPDFLPRVGRLDDAAVMEMACQLANDGLRRYCDAKGIAADAVLGARSARSAPA